MQAGSRLRGCAALNHAARRRVLAARCLQVAKTGLKTPFRKGTVRDVAAQVVAIASEGLEERGLDEVRFLDQLSKMVEAGENRAEVLLRLYDEEWQQSVDPIYTMMAF